MITAQEVAATVGNLNKRGRKAIPRALSDVPPVYLFNIYKLEHRRPMGSLGEFYIPPCPEGQEYVSTKIKGAFFDEYDEGEGKLSWNYDGGREVAAAIVGEGLDDTSNNLPRHWGVFWSVNEKPTRQELAKCRELLTAKQKAVLAQGDKLALQGDKGLAQIQAIHREAATFLKQHRSWESGDTETQMSECPGCGGYVKPGIAKCGQCGAILDFPKAFALGLTPHRIAPGAEGGAAQQKLVS
jgi:hypothetical protein